MEFFTKEETVGVATILILIIGLSLYNLQISLRRARDVQRKADLSAISNALARYEDDFGFYPPSSEDGKIVACKKEGVTPSFKRGSEEGQDAGKIDLLEVYKPCEWGKDSLRDVFDLDYPPYLQVIPADPHLERGVSYRYVSNGRRFQIYASLEGEDEDGVNIKIVERKLGCGSKVCNFGKSSGETPLEISIEEYENRLLEEKLKNQK